MRLTEPFVREAGAGAGVVCIHANASSSGQWRALMDALAPRFRVFAPDSYGAGKSPEWHADRSIGLSDEVALIEPVIARAGAPVAVHQVRQVVRRDGGYVVDGDYFARVLVGAGGTQCPVARTVFADANPRARDSLIVTQEEELA